MFLIILITLILFSILYYYLNDRYLYPQRIKQINSLMSDEQYDAALKIVNNLPEKKKILPEVQFSMYKIYLNQKQYFMALFHLNEIVKRNNYTNEITELDVHLRTAEVYELMEKNKKALVEYDKVINLDSDNMTANKRLGEILFYLKNYSGAKPYLEKYFELDDSDPEINKMIAEIYYKEEEYSQALNMIDMSISYNPEKTEYYLIKGKCLLKLDKPEESIEFLTKLEIDPVHNNFSKVLLGIAFYLLKRYSEAENSFSSALLKYNNDGNEFILQARYYYSQILSHNGELKKALRQLYFIHNSGKTFKNVKFLIPLYTKIISSKLLDDIQSDNIENFINSSLSKGLSINGQTIINSEIFSKKSGYFITKKNISSGQSYQTVIGVDFSLKETSTDFISRFLSYIEAHDLSSGSFFTLFGLAPNAKTLLSASKFEIEILTFEKFESIVTGQKTL